MRGAQTERMLRNELEAQAFCLRGAGSLGVDLVAIKEGVAYCYEVKSCSEDIWRINRSAFAREQYERFKLNTALGGCLSFYAIYFPKLAMWSIVPLEAMDADTRITYLDGESIEEHMARIYSL